MEELHLTHSSSMWSAGQAWEEAAALTLSLQGDQNAQHAPWDHVETLLSASAEEGASVNLRQAAVREILLYLNTSVWKITLLSSDLLPSASLMCALFKDSFKFYVLQKMSVTTELTEERLLFTRRPRIMCSVSAHLPVWDEWRWADFVFSAHFTAPLWTNKSVHVGLRNHCMALVYLCIICNPARW